MTTINEHDIQNQIRLTISQQNLGVSFRTNVGTAWTGDNVIHNPDKSVTIINARPFQTGLPKGFSDLLVVTPVIITPDMIGQLIARAGFLEIKTKTGRVRPEQINFIEQMQRLGARAGVARLIEDAIQILKG